MISQGFILIHYTQLADGLQTYDQTLRLFEWNQLPHYHPSFQHNRNTNDESILTCMPE